MTGFTGIAGCRTLCPITDPYVAHHAALGSLAWVHLEDLSELDRARGALAALPGVEGVLDRSAAAVAFDLPADRIGDLIVLADAHTVLVPFIVCAPLPAGALAGRQLHNRDLHDVLLNAVTV